MVIARNAQAVFILSLLVIFAIGYIHFFQVSIIGNVVYEPLIKDNSLEVSKVMNFLNILEIYKLNEIPLTNEKPIIELIIPESQKTYLVTVENHQYEISFSKAKPDIRVRVEEDILNELVLDPSGTHIADAISDSTLNIEILSDEKTIALKGYKNLYNKISAQGITGKVIDALNPIEFNNMLFMTAIIFFCVILGLVIEKEF